MEIIPLSFKIRKKIGNIILANPETIFQSLFLNDFYSVNKNKTKILSDFLKLPHGTTPAAVITNKNKTEML